MSIALINKAWLARCTTACDKLLLVLLADRANAAGYCWPHFPCIIDDSGMSKQGIVNCMARLESDGHITVKRKKRCANLYLIHPIPDPDRIEQSGQQRGPVVVNSVDQSGQQRGPVVVNSVDQSGQQRGPATEPKRTVKRTQTNRASNSGSLKRIAEDPSDAWRRDGWTFDKLKRYPSLATEMRKGQTKLALEFSELYLIDPDGAKGLIGEATDGSKKNPAAWLNRAVHGALRDAHEGIS